MSSAAPLSLPSTTPATKRTSFVATVPTEVDSALAIMEKTLFVRASELLAKVTVATKDGSGRICWITLEPAFHSVLVKTALSAVKANSPNHCAASTKEALFIFLLAVLNGQPQAKFFDAKKVEATSNRANRERKRLARKRSRAAKREREREAAVLQNPKHLSDDVLAASKPSGSTRTCLRCETKFASRKKLSRHSCQVKRAEDDTTKRQTGVSDAKRARRAKARKARRDAEKARKVAFKLKKEELAAAAKKLRMLTPVTDSSGKARECENCNKDAVGAVHHGSYRYPKCDDCGSGRSEFKYFRACDTCPGTPA